MGGKSIAMKIVLPILAFALCLTGCVRSIETRVDTMGGGAGMMPGSYVLAPAEKALSPELLQAQQLVAAHLLSKNFTPAANGTLYLQVTASTRPADLGLATTNATTPVILSAPLKTRVSSKCVNSEYRVSVTLTRISDGQEAYRGIAAETHCKASLSQTLPALIDAALGDLRMPVGIAGRQGAYVLKRKLNR